MSAKCHTQTSRALSQAAPQPYTIPRVRLVAWPRLRGPVPLFLLRLRIIEALVSPLLVDGTLRRVARCFAKPVIEAGQNTGPLRLLQTD